VTTARSAAQTQVCAEAIDQPLVPTAGMNPPQDDDVAQSEIDDTAVIWRQFGRRYSWNAVATLMAASDSIRARDIRGDADAPPIGGSTPPSRRHRAARPRAETAIRAAAMSRINPETAISAARRYSPPGPEEPLPSELAVPGLAGSG